MDFRSFSITTSVALSAKHPNPASHTHELGFAVTLTLGSLMDAPSGASVASEDPNRVEGFHFQ